MEAVMKRFGSISAVFGTAALLLLFGSTSPAQAFQEEHPQEEHPQDAKPPENAKPPHDQEAKPPKEEQPPKDANAPKENARPADHPENRAEAKSTVKHGPIENGRIPDAQFHSHFGREHTFHVGHPVVVEGQSRFQYGGYWFGFGEAWPVGWAYTDDVYVDYIDGQYFLIDPVHPGLRLALVVVL
jgi:hypothetical protein